MNSHYNNDNVNNYFANGGDVDRTLLLNSLNAIPTKVLDTDVRRSEPGMNTEAYLDYVIRRSKACGDTMATAAVYLQRLHARHPNITAGQGGKHRLLTAAIMVAHKVLYDEVYTNASWVKICGGFVPLLELNAMEIELLKLLSYEMHVTDTLINNLRARAVSNQWIWNNNNNSNSNVSVGVKTPTYTNMSADFSCSTESASATTTRTATPTTTTSVNSGSTQLSAMQTQSASVSSTDECDNCKSTGWMGECGRCARRKRRAANNSNIDSNYINSSTSSRNLAGDIEMTDAAEGNVLESSTVTACDALESSYASFNGSAPSDPTAMYSRHRTPFGGSSSGTTTSTTTSNSTSNSSVSSSAQQNGNATTNADFFAMISNQIQTVADTVMAN